jgi:hypothetical protein
MHGRDRFEAAVKMDSRLKKRLTRIADFLRAESVFPLDSFHSPSLTLRDYSKVVAEPS